MAQPAQRVGFRPLTLGICYRDCFKLNLKRYVDFCLDKRCNGAQFDEAAKFMGYSK